MGFKQANLKEEKKALNKLIKSDPKAKKAYEEFINVYNFRKSLVLARKKQNITQKDLSKKTGLSQQVISRIETGSTDTTLTTLCKYLKGIGCGLDITKIG